MDGKHTIFGKLVGGLDTLNELEKIEVDNKDRPIEDIIIQKAQVFVDPFQEADEQLLKERADEIVKQQQIAIEERKRKQKATPLKVYREGVGKYLNTNKESVDSQSSSSSTNTDLPAKKKKYNSSSFGNFSAW